MDRYIYQKKNKDAVIDVLRYCINAQGMNMYAYCLMTNQLCMIVNCNEHFQLSDVIRDFKRHTVKTILKQIQEEPESRREWLLKLFEENRAKSDRNKKHKFWQ